MYISQSRGVEISKRVVFPVQSACCEIHLPYIPSGQTLMCNNPLQLDLNKVTEGLRSNRLLFISLLLGEQQLMRNQYK
jgi:hypothetical protein